MITFEDFWNFLEITRIDDNVLHLIDKESNKINSNNYVYETLWEKRFDYGKLKTYWEDGYTFLAHGNINSKVRNLIEEIEEENNVHAMCHCYAGKFGSRSFPIHSDKPDNLIIQCIGKTRVTLYNDHSEVADVFWGNFEDLTVKDQFILSPGDSVYISSLQYHLFEPLTDRLSISIPMIKL